METLSIVCAKPFSIESIRQAISGNSRVEMSNADTLIVHGVESRAYLHLDVTSSTLGKHCLLLDYSDVELAKSLVERIANTPDLIVDNDFGTVLPGNQFVARIRAEKGWDWRRSPKQNPV